MSATPGRGVGFWITGLAPITDPAWALCGAAGRLAFHRRAARAARQIYADERARRIDRHGRPLAPLSPKTIQRRRSAMGRAIKTAPQFTPALARSRTIAYLTATETESGVWMSWRFDAHTGREWGEILMYHALGLVRGAPPRDVLGLSPQGTAQLRRRMAGWWRRHRPRLARHAPAAGPVAVGAVPARPLPPSARAAAVLARVRGGPGGGPLPSAVPLSGRTAGGFHLDLGVLHSGDRAAIERAIAAGTSTGFRQLGSRWRPPPSPRVAPVLPPPMPRAPADASREPSRPWSVAATTEREAEALVRDMLGRRADLPRVARLAGAAPDTRVTMRVRDGLVQLAAAGRGHRGAYRLSLDDSGRPRLMIESFEADPPRRGAATRMLTRTLRAAAALDVRDIQLFGARDERHAGYRVWPRLGFDALLPEDILAALPGELATARTIRELYGMPGGRQWWETNGRGLGMTFDLTPGSPSWRAYRAYRSERRRRIR